MKLTAGQIIAKALKQYGVEYVAGLPGHGNWSMIDAFNDPGFELPFIQTLHEQSAMHLADGYYRASGKVMATTTSIGPGAANAVIGLATAFADSTAMLLLTGGPATHMRGHGVMQELDRAQTPDWPRLASVVCKRQYEVLRADQLPFMLQRAFNSMLTGRPGPVNLELPLDVQTDVVDVEIQDLRHRLPTGRSRPDADAVLAAARLLVEAERPVIVAGGGAIGAEASPELIALAERIGAPVVYTWNGKAAIPDDHRLCAGTAGWPGSISGNTLAASADVVLSVGCKFTDWSASSYRKGSTFSFPPAKLIQVDIDPYEIGKNYPAELGLVGDAKSALADLGAAIDASDSRRALAAREQGYFAEIAGLKDQWEQRLHAKRSSDASPMTMHRVLAELRQVLPRNGMVTVGSGHPQGSVKQGFPLYEPRSHITSGSYSSMGFAVPSAIGAKIARPENPVVCVVGDGDFLQTAQEMALCVMREIPVVFLVLNNQGYISIRDGQNGLMGRQIGSEFNATNGEPYSPDFVAMAKSYGLAHATAVDRPHEVGKALSDALASGGPALVEASITREQGGPEVVGWWDFPLLPHVEESMREGYAAAVTEEQHR